MHRDPYVFMCNRSLGKFKESWIHLWSPPVCWCGTPDFFHLFLDCQSDHFFLTGSFSCGVGGKGNFGLQVNKLTKNRYSQT